LGFYLIFKRIFIDFLQNTGIFNKLFIFNIHKDGTMKNFLIVVAISLLVSCGHPYCHPNKPTAQIDRDYKECDYEAEKYTGNLAAGTARATNRSSLISKCMELRGYGSRLPFSEECYGYELIKNDKAK
jgi:hypothetical protein